MIVQGVFQKLLILIAFILLSFSNSMVSGCPNGTYAILPSLGSSYNCVSLIVNNSVPIYFTQAEQFCTGWGGHLLSIPNGYVNMIILGESILHLFRHYYHCFRYNRKFTNIAQRCMDWSNKYCWRSVEKHRQWKQCNVLQLGSWRTTK